jgi:arginase
MRTIKILKNRSDLGAGTRGSDMGVDAIEIAAINKGNDYFNRFPFEDIETENETIYNKVKNSFAKRIGSVLRVCTRLADAVKRTMHDGHFPIVLSGDHSSALGTISGIKAAYPEKVLGVVWIDAHADLHSPYTSPSGNIHGMPLSAALNDDNLIFQINTVVDDTDKYWTAMKNVGIEGAKIMHKHIVFFGVRDSEFPEEDAIVQNGMKNFTVPEFRYKGSELCIAEALERLEECDILYISFDVDSLDCDLISRGTGTPVSKGFDVVEVKQIIEGIVSSGKVACLEVVEVNPTLDNKGNRMAETAFDVLDHATDKLLKSFDR